ncbi:thiamine pyrophosphate-binding protein [Plastorhodobacter daqingensis]|uniref:Thiamine pyrophosphate-binding protein n=1 Tax=Plastorhodobacter daqingensis TaxID=1387281 RepID=A0ABW2UL82_9RHOB
MTDPRIYDMLAHAFHAEGTRLLFTLLGDGNMHWATALEGLGCRLIHARHEHCAVSMAMAAVNAGEAVGVASVTCGPGLTQIMTALATAVRAHLPLVVFAGEAPLRQAWYNQEIDQAPFVTATGATYIRALSPARMADQVREAFFIARQERRPVVIGVPFDLQAQPAPDVKPYQPSTTLLPKLGRMQPDPAQLAEVARAVAAARRVIVVAGRGARAADAAAACVALADRCGGLLAATLPVRGLFHDHPFDLGVAGGFSSDTARAAFAEADLVLAVGASVTHHTADGGKLWPEARVVQIDSRPIGFNQGRRVADLYLQADARAGVEALLAALPEAPATPGFRSAALAERLQTAPADATPFPARPGLLDPRAVIRRLDAILPRDWEMVNASGHCSYFAAQMRGRPAEHFHTIREFGAIGNGLSYAIGVAAAKPGRPVVLFDGDGGFLMHAQELETVRRHGLPILLCLLNDGAYGSEIHKLRADGLPDAGAVFGRGDLGAVARGFGLDGAVVTDLAGLEAQIARFAETRRGMVLDFHIDDDVTSPVMRRAHPPKAH